MNVVLTVRERARGNVSTPVVLWALAMTVVLFMEVVNPSALVTVSGFVVTALLGALLGWRRRMGTVIAAPFVGWLLYVKLKIQLPQSSRFDFGIGYSCNINHSSLF